jgi:hypothetical protein
VPVVYIAAVKLDNSTHLLQKYQHHLLRRSAGLHIALQAPQLAGSCMNIRPTEVMLSGLPMWQ